MKNSIDELKAIINRIDDEGDLFVNRFDLLTAFIKLVEPEYLDTYPFEEVLEYFANSNGECFLEDLAIDIEDWLENEEEEEEEE